MIKFVLVFLISLFCSPAAVYASSVATPSAAEDVNNYDPLAPDSWVPDDAEDVGGPGRLDDASDFVNDVVPLEYVDYVERNADDFDMFASDNGVFEDYHRNIVVFTGMIGGQQYDLVVPFTAYSVLDIYDNELVNVGSSNVVGRLLPVGGVIDPTEYDFQTFTLSPVYGGSSNVYRYGSMNYITHYYENDRGTGITSSQTYGTFVVEDITLYYGFADRLYYAVIVCFALLFGGWILWKLRF